MLSIPASRPLSLYLHVPFCTTRCAYCAFYSEPESRWKGFREQYVERLEKEITTVVQQIGKFETIFIGGGNPGSLRCDQIVRLLEAAGSKTCREVTIEMNPETFTEQLEPLFSKGLVTRLSMGIQSMDASVLRQLGRNTTVKENLRAIKLAGEVRKAFGIDLSFDLMTALPGQSIQMAQKDIETLVSLCDVDHLSLYCLTVEEGTELAQKVASKELSVFDDDGQRVLLQSLWNQLHEMGYTHYEVSNFAKHNAECKHNLVYWNLEPYLGLGCSAASLLREGNNAWHYSQIQDLGTYVNETLFSGYEREALTVMQCIEEYLLMTLRTHYGIKKKDFALRFSLQFDSLFSKTIAHLDEGWYRDTDQLFVLTEDGWMVLDEIVLRLCLEIPEPLDRHQRL